MMSMRIQYLLPAAMALAVPAVLAQHQGDMFAWWDSPVVRDLNLSEDQTRQIKTTTREYRDRLIDLRAATEKAEVNLGDLMNEDQPDTKKVNEAIDRVVAARGEMMRAVSQMSLKLRLVLTPQQWRELQKRRPPMMSPGGPGRPGQDRQMRPGQGPGPRRQPGGNRQPEPEGAAQRQPE